MGGGGPKLPSLQEIGDAASKALGAPTTEDQFSKVAKTAKGVTNIATQVATGKETMKQNTLKFNATRTQQKSQKLQKGGRAGTILTSSQATDNTLGSGTSGKTLLGQ